ncbi:MAG TPA: diguanylate cyclase [Bdellovibrionales bacterium]|nr:diguanylate cyclase [Bdellovibrionales bacterium]
MVRRILLLDDEPGLAHRHESILKGRGYEVLRPRSLADVRVLADSGQVSLIVHSCNKTKTHEGLCTELSEKYPHLPTLHLETGNGISKAHRKGGVLHRVIGHLGPERALVNNVRALTELGRLKYRDKVQRSILGEIQLLDGLLQELETPKLTYLMLEQLEAWTGATNVFWLAPGDVDYYLNEMWKIQSISSAEAFVRPAESRIVTRHPIEFEEISAHLNEVAKVWDYHWRSAKGPSISQKVAVLPVTDPDDRSILGYFFVIDPQRMKMGTKYWLNRFALAYKQSVKYMEARGLCYIDDVTELYNQRYLGLALDAEISRAKRNNTPFSVLFMDVDHFKQVNDKHSHLVGSAVLRKISRILKKNIRNFDYGFRYGGDEYMLLLVNTNSEAARIVGERIRKEVENTVFRAEGAEVKVTLSIGVASFPEHAATKEEIIALADKAMYHGKNKSRNIVFVAS